jgi:PTS system nitrogen regulatory IIA component
MDLRKKDVAELLTVSIHTIDALIAAGKIPNYTIKGEQRFNRTEIENWMMRTLSLEKDTLPFGENEGNYGPWQQFGLYRAIHKGDVLSDLLATSKEEIIREAMDRSSETLSLDPEIVTDLLLEREQLMPTALNNGIAIPHAREFLLRGLFDAVIVVYPTSPMDWGALDGAPVHTLFFLFACDDKRHLNLLAKVAHLSSSKEALEFLQTKPSKHALLDYIKNWEANIQSQRSPNFESLCV